MERYIEQGIEGLKLGYSPKRELSFISREKRSNSFDYRYAYPFDRGKITMMKTPDASSTISEPKRKIEPTRKLSYWKLKSPKFGTIKKAKTELNNFLEQSRQCNHAEGSFQAIAQNLV